MVLPPALDAGGWELFPQHVNDANRNSKTKNGQTTNPLHNRVELGASRPGSLNQDDNFNGTQRADCISTQTGGNEEATAVL